MQLFYNPNVSETDQTIQFSKEESRHMVKVLRKTLGDQLHITNGLGWLFTAEITQADSKNCMAKITHSKFEDKHKYQLHLAVAPTKMNDRFEWFLEKATEIGIDSITPIFCENSERRVVKAERFEKILQSAMKQSLSCYLPKLNAALSFHDFINQEFEGDRYIAHCEDTQKLSLKNAVQPKTKITILIGPEGDFSASEIGLAKAKHFKSVTLGNTRLRTETAAIVACHSVAFVNEA